MVTMEDYNVASDGRVVSRRPQNYKLPTIRDIPRQFNVLLSLTLDRAVYSSKVGCFVDSQTLQKQES
jgi:xanthine dehydrogenase molybdopterin-binding subunit B